MPRGWPAALLLRAVCEWALEQGARSVALWVVDTNAPARRLYERNGSGRPANASPYQRAEPATRNACAAVSATCAQAAGNRLGERTAVSAGTSTACAAQAATALPRAFQRSREVVQRLPTSSKHHNDARRQS
ncbi:MAG: GNAT family N-acetyltransferase [Acidimicrobiales bacterium]